MLRIGHIVGIVAGVLLIVGAIFGVTAIPASDTTQQALIDATVNIGSLAAYAGGVVVVMLLGVLGKLSESPTVRAASWGGAALCIAVLAFAISRLA